jgi:hypothetical protein
MMAAVKSSPAAVVIVENGQALTPAFKAVLKEVGYGRPGIDKAGARISFRQAMVFVLVHRTLEGLPDAGPGGDDEESQGGTGHSVVADVLMSTLGFDTELAWAVHGTYRFALPGPVEQARVVHLLMEEECRKFRVTLRRIGPDVLAREVEASERSGGFHVLPGRVTRLLEARIADAIGKGQTTIDVG